MDRTAQQSIDRTAEHRDHLARNLAAFDRAIADGRDHLDAGRLDEAETCAREASRVATANAQSSWTQHADALNASIEHAQGIDRGDE